MYRLIYSLFCVCVLLLFAANASLLDFLGWGYYAAGGNALTKNHPALYLLAVTALLTLASRPVWGDVVRPAFLLFAAATLILLARAVAILLAGAIGGELSAVLVTFVTPLFLLVTIHGIRTEDLRRLAVPIRVFMAVNSLMALAERAIGYRLIPSWIDATSDDRATALVAHPLNGSLLTGLMITYLVTARRGDAPVWQRLPELALHAVAMFAFGGRSALVFTTTVLILSAVVGRQQRGQARLTPLQRVLPLAIVALGLGLIFLPIPFVDATLDRFTNAAGSSQTRNSAATMLAMLGPNELMAGVDVSRRAILMNFLHTPYGIELAWVALAISYGLVATLPMLVALPLQLFAESRPLDRSAFYMVILFLVVTTGSLSIGAKSLLISELFVMMHCLAQPRRTALLFRRDATDRVGARPSP